MNIIHNPKHKIITKASLTGVKVVIFFLMYVTVSCTLSTLSCKCPISSFSSSLESFVIWFPSSSNVCITFSLLSKYTSPTVFSWSSGTSII